MIEDLNKPVVDVQDLVSSQIVSDELKPINIVDIFNILGMLDIVTTAPTAAPSSLYGQVKLYTDSLTTPTVYTLYIYMPKIKVWKSVALT